MTKLYSMNGCPKCEHAKKLLTAAGIEYTEVRDPSEASKLGFLSAPVLVFENGIALKYPEIVRMYTPKEGGLHG